MPGSKPTPSPPASQRVGKPTLPPPQFGLRTLLLLVTACAMLAALSQWVTPVVIACVAFLMLCVVAHVAGNWMGTRLRDAAPRQSPDDVAPAGFEHGKPAAGDFAPASRLGQRTNLGWPIVVAAALGVISGAAGGAVWTLVSSRGPIGWMNVAVGGLAFAVLGGIMAFAACGFVQVGLSALRQAHSDPKS
jgi:hypothetical protein